MMPRPETGRCPVAYRRSEVVMAGRKVRRLVVLMALALAVVLGGCTQPEGGGGSGAPASAPADQAPGY